MPAAGTAAGNNYRPPFGGGTHKEYMDMTRDEHKRRIVRDFRGDVKGVPADPEIFCRRKASRLARRRIRHNDRKAFATYITR
jgi:hypothetical protein